MVTQTNIGYFFKICLVIGGFSVIGNIPEPQWNLWSKLKLNCGGPHFDFVCWLELTHLDLVISHK